MRDITVLTNNGVDIQKSLEVFKTMEKYDSTLEVFYMTIQKNLQGLQEYKDTDDMAKYAVLIHSIKSESRYFGFEQLSDMAYKHEIESKTNNMCYIHDNFAELLKEINKTIEIIGQYLGKVPVS